MTPANNAKQTRDRLAAAAATRPGQAAGGAAANTPPAVARPERQTKYTLLLDAADEDTIQDFVYHARRELGVPIDKSDAYRAFLALLRDDPALAGRVRDYIAAAKTQ